MDKDHSPRWNPPTLEEVSHQMVEQCFSSLGHQDLTLESPTFKNAPQSL